MLLQFSCSILVMLPIDAAFLCISSSRPPETSTLINQIECSTNKFIDLTLVSRSFSSHVIAAIESGLRAWLAHSELAARRYFQNAFGQNELTYLVATSETNIYRIPNWTKPNRKPIQYDPNCAVLNRTVRPPGTPATTQKKKTEAFSARKRFLMVFVFNTKLEDFNDATNNFKAICGMVYGFTYYILYVYVDITNIYWRSTRWNDEMNELFARLYLVSNVPHTHSKQVSVS